MTKTELVLERLHRNGVLTPFDTMDSCVHSLVGIQSQVQQFAELAILNRCSGAPAMKDFESAYASNRIINLWGQRNTLHMYVSADWDLICDLYHDRMYAERLAARNPASMKNLCALVREKAIAEKCLTRMQIQELLDTQGSETPSDDIPLTYMYLNYFCANGFLFGIPDKPSIKQFAPYTALNKPQWKSEPARLSDSLDEMMKRYFQYYGPATLQDFRHWSGLPAGLSKEALSRLDSVLTKTTLPDRTYYTYGSIEIKKTRKLTLLGKFDPLFVSYRHKDWIITQEQEKQIWRNAGHVEAVVLDGTKVIGTWRHTLKGNKIAIRIEPLAAISGDTKERIQTKAKKLSRFWQKELDEILYL